jgi:hypothetical protein
MNILLPRKNLYTTKQSTDQMTAKQIEKNFQEIRELFKETDRRLDHVLANTSREVEKATKAVDALGSKWGRFVEGLLVPAVERLFQQRGITVDKVSQRVKVRKNGREMEIDILAINQGYVVLIEAKSTLSVENVNEHLQNLRDFKFFFPEYADRKIIGAVAGIVIDAGADRYAYKCGLFVIGQSGETVKILNDKKFVPNAW